MTFNEKDANDLQSAVIAMSDKYTNWKPTPPEPVPPNYEENVRKVITDYLFHVVYC